MVVARLGGGGGGDERSLRNLRRSSSDTDLERLARELVDETDERGEGDGLEAWWEEEEELVESEMSELCHMQLWVSGMVHERKLRHSF